MSPYFVLRAPDQVTIFYNIEDDGHDSKLSGRICCVNMRSLVNSCIDAQIHLLRLGTVDREQLPVTDATPKRRPKLFRPSSQLNWSDFEGAEKILSCPITLALDSESNKASCAFQLKVPAHLPPTISFPSIRISYAIVVSTTLPCGQILRTGQLLKIYRRPVEPIPLQSTPRAYSNSTLALQVSFEEPKPRVQGVAATLHLMGLRGISLNGAQDPLRRDDKMIKTAPQMVHWEVEEKAIAIGGLTDRVDVSTATTYETTRIIKSGIHRNMTGSSSEQSGDKGLNFEADIPFHIDVPEDVDFPSSSFGADCLLSAWSSENSRCESARFELYLEQYLRVKIRMGEHLTSENLVHGKPAWYTYTAVLPLKGVSNTSKHGDAAPAAQQGTYYITREAL
jgi:hypothetical protein